MREAERQTASVMFVRASPALSSARSFISVQFVREAHRHLAADTARAIDHRAKAVVLRPVPATIHEQLITCSAPACGLRQANTEEEANGDEREGQQAESLCAGLYLPGINVANPELNTVVSSLI